MVGQLGAVGGSGSVGGGSAPPPATGWVRPADWPAMPVPGAADEIDILAAVENNGSQFTAVNATVIGGYTVDWGDGTVENVASGVQRDHQYIYATLGTAVTSRGYKTAMVKITAQVPANSITAFNLSQKNATAGLAAYVNPWLDIQAQTPAATTTTLRGAIEARWCERVNFLAIGNITSLLSFFQNFSALQSVGFPAGSLTNVTTCANMFQSCLQLEVISLPAGSLGSVTTMASMFNTCASLTTVSMPATAFGASLNLMTSMFTGCTTLRSFAFPAGSLLTAVTNISSMFSSCIALQSMTFPAGSLGAVTTMASAFSGCTSLQYVVFPSGLGASLTTIASAFSACTSIGVITFPAASLGSVTTTTTAFSGCTNLERIDNCGLPVSFSANCNLAATELNSIYTALPVIVAQTMTCSANWGFAASNQAIATGKGWTLA